MDYQRKAETGLQLFARLSARPSLVGLEDRLFSSGPNHKDIIEISGDPATGKTLLLNHFLVKCLLPEQWNSILLGGLGAGAILINTDHHFKILKLISLMGQKLKIFLKPKQNNEVNANNFSKKKYLKSEDIEDIIKHALKNLIILNCFDSLQLFVTFCSLEKLLSSCNNISLILLDSLSAYYWQDVMTGGSKRMYSYQTKLLQTLNKYVHEYRMVVIYTKQSYFQSKYRDVGGRNSDALMNSNPVYKIELKHVDSENRKKFCASVQTAASEYCNFYTINESGIEWVDSR